MNNEARTILLGTLFILAFGIVSNAVMKNGRAHELTEISKGSWACTTDVQICPDGSTVGRTPPYCLFAGCEN